MASYRDWLNQRRGIPNTEVPDTKTDKNQVLKKSDDAEKSKEGRKKIEHTTKKVTSN